MLHKKHIWVCNRGQGSDENYPRDSGSDMIRLREARNSHVAETAMPAPASVAQLVGCRPQTKWLLVRFPVRVNASVVGSAGLFFSLSFSLPSSL